MNSSTAGKRYSTLNDVIMAVAAGALRRYLLHRGELPAKSVVSMMPMSTRAPGDLEMTNRVPAALCALHTNVEDPIERLRAISAETRVIKTNLAETRQSVAFDLPSFGMPWLVSGMASLFGKLRLADVVPTWCRRSAMSS